MTDAANQALPQANNEQVNSNPLPSPAANSEHAVSPEQPRPDDVPKEPNAQRPQATGAAPAPRLKIGSQREAPSSATAPTEPGPGEATAERARVAEPKTSRLAAKITSDLKRSQQRVPVPNIRRELPPELQVELELAMGGKSLDELIGDEQSIPAGEELPPETRLTGRVVAVHKEDVFIDIGQPSQGVVPLSQFAEPPEIGAALEVVVSRYDADEGLYELSLPGGAVEIGDWSQVAEGMVVEARVTGVNKGGLECDVNHLRGFIPASQIGLYRVDDLASLVGEKWHCVITEAKPEKRNLVLSRRAYLERQREAARRQLLAELAPGQVREGVVRNIQAFGAFVDLGGVDGLVHISEISWQRVSHPSEVLEIGQPVKVRIKKIDPDTGKISLGLKELSESPWDRVADKYPVRSTARGKVSKIMEFGAFVELEPGVEGLVHISELDYKRIFRVSDVVTVGQEVEAQVLAVDPAQRRISLSIKALKSRPAPEQKPEAEVVERQTEAVPGAKKKRKLALKGGRDKTSGGERFGLKW
jgi:small subunit ribosomal protein S1